MINLETIVMEVSHVYIEYGYMFQYELHFRWRFWDDVTGHEYIDDFYVDNFDIEEYEDWPWAMSNGYILKVEDSISEWDKTQPQGWYR